VSLYCLCVGLSLFLISFIYSSAGRSADTGERERRHRSERQKVSECEEERDIQNVSIQSARSDV